MEALQGTHFLRSGPPFEIAGTPSYFVQNAHSNDIDDQAAMLGGWEQRYIQYENGSFEGAVQALSLPSSTLFRKSTNRKLHKRFAPPPNETAFAVLLSGSDPAIFQGRQVGPGDVLLIPGGREHELICHGTFDVVVATFPNTGSDLVNVCGDVAIVRPGVVREAKRLAWEDGLSACSGNRPEHSGPMPWLTLPIFRLRLHADVPNWSATKANSPTASNDMSAPGPCRSSRPCGKTLPSISKPMTRFRRCRSSSRSWEFRCERWNIPANRCLTFRRSAI